jgi:hypothetical protein
MVAQPSGSAAAEPGHHAALTGPQIFRGYQWVEYPPEPLSAAVLACVDSPLPLSDGKPRMRAAPAVI